MLSVPCHYLFVSGGFLLQRKYVEWHQWEKYYNWNMWNNTHTTANIPISPSKIKSELLCQTSTVFNYGKYFVHIRTKNYIRNQHRSEPCPDPSKGGIGVYSRDPKHYIQSVSKRKPGYGLCRQGIYIGSSLSSQKNNMQCSVKCFSWIPIKYYRKCKH